MSRFTMTLAAAAAAAVAAIAAVALPAIGDSGPARQRAAKDADFAKFAACLRANGLADAPTTPEELKPWLAAKEASDPQATEAAERACKAQLVKPGAGAGPSVADFVACLRSHGVDAPTAPDAFKRWLAGQQPNDVLRQCKLALDPGPKPGDPGKPGTCGDDAKPSAGKAEPPADQPEQPADESDQRST
jgi:hypothetical protein